jgi:DNA-binding transcriptional regulator LsrR (DeoR family)
MDLKQDWQAVMDQAATRRDIVVSKYKSGMSQAEIGREMKMSRQTVSRLIKTARRDGLLEAKPSHDSGIIERVKEAVKDIIR